MFFLCLGFRFGFFFMIKQQIRGYEIRYYIRFRDFFEDIVNDIFFFICQGCMINFFKENIILEDVLVFYGFIYFAFIGVFNI